MLKQNDKNNGWPHKYYIRILRLFHEGRNQLTCLPKTQLHLLVTPFPFWQQHRLPSLLTFCYYTGFPSTQSLVGSRQCHWSQNLTACTFGQKIEWYRNIDMIQSLNFPCPVLLETNVWPPQTWNTLVTKYQTVSKELEVRWSMGKYAFTSIPPFCFLQILQNAGTGQLAIQVNSKLQRGQQSWSARDWQFVPIIKLYWTRKTHKNSV